MQSNLEVKVIYKGFGGVYKGLRDEEMKGRD